MVSFQSRHFPRLPALLLLCLTQIHVTTAWQLYDLRTLHLFISGRGKKTRSTISRSSSGFESSHLPSPEYPVLPLPLASIQSSKSSSHSKPRCFPHVHPNLPKRGLSSIKGRIQSRSFARSHSCMELRRNAAQTPLRRCFSLTILHKDQKRRLLLRPKDLNLYIKSTKNPLTVVRPSSHALCRTSYTAACTSTATQQAHPEPPPTAPPKRSSDHVAAPSLLNPEREPLPTVMPDREHIFLGERKGASVSATSEACRLKRKELRSKSGSGASF